MLNMLENAHFFTEEVNKSWFSTHLKIELSGTSQKCIGLIIILLYETRIHIFIY